MRRRIVVFVIIIQSVLFLGHAFLYETLVAFWHPGQASVWKLQVTLAVLSVSFVGASLLAFRYANLLVRGFYALAAAWLGVFSFCFYAACICWGVSGGAALLGFHPQRQIVAAVIFGAALVVSAYGIVNAALPRVKRVTVKLPNLPQSWRGRTAALVSDTHLEPCPESRIHQTNRGKARAAHTRRRFHCRRFVRRHCSKCKAAGRAAGEIVSAAWDLFRRGQSRRVLGSHEISRGRPERGRSRLEQRKSDGGWIAVGGRALPRWGAAGTAAADSAARSSGSRTPEHSTEPWAASARDRRRRRNFTTAFRAHARRAVLSVHADCFAHLWRVRIWLATVREYVGVHVVRRGDMGSPVARGNNTRDCADSIRVKVGLRHGALRSSRRDAVARRWPAIILRGGERGPVILVAFKAIDPALREPNGGFDSHTLPPQFVTKSRAGEVGRAGVRFEYGKGSVHSRF